MESRRIRRVRKPTAWQRWVTRCHAWLEDTLERAVCCGVDPDSLDAATRFSMGSKQASAAFSVGSMGAYALDDSEFENYEDACEALSDTESESTADDDHLSHSRVVSIDMDRRYSCVGEGDDETERRRTSVSSEYVPFDDDDDNMSVATDRHGDQEDGRREHEDSASAEEALLRERNRMHRCYFNCVLAELLMTSHPVVLWADARD